MLIKFNRQYSIFLILPYNSHSLVNLVVNSYSKSDLISKNNLVILVNPIAVVIANKCSGSDIVRPTD